MEKFDLIFLYTVQIKITGNVTQDQNLRSLVKSDLDKRSGIANVILDHDLRSYELRSLPTLITGAMSKIVIGRAFTATQSSQAALYRRFRGP